MNGAKTSTIADDTIEYRVFSLNKTTELESLKKSCLTLVEETVGSKFIWNEQPFNLQLYNDGNIDMLLGRTTFDDSVDDEWLIVYLLKKISATFDEVIVQMEDACGQLLLIEAAEHIPKWLTPDTATNRVFLGQDKLLIIPSADVESQLPTGSLQIDQSLAFLSTHMERCAASAPVQKCIKEKLSDFPRKSLDNIHRLNVRLPRSGVEFLAAFPSSVSRAVQAANTCDVIDMSLHRRTRFALPGQDVWAQVRMTRVQYAKINHKLMRKFKASTLSPDKKGTEIGKMLRLGLEILYAKSLHSGSVDEKKLQAYIKSLADKGYFQDEMEGSRKYMKLEAAAKEAFARSECGNEESETMVAFFQSWKEENETECELLIAKRRSELPAESDDRFMEIDDTELDCMMTDMQEGFKKLNEKHKETARGVDQTFPDFADKINGFVNSTSDYEGVEVAKKKSSASAAIDFNPDHFMASLEKMLNDVNEKDSDSDEFLSDDDATDVDDDEDEKGSDDDEMKSYYESMETELKSTQAASSVSADPVDIDMNLVKNFLKSCEDEDTSGATSVLLASLDTTK